MTIIGQGAEAIIQKVTKGKDEPRVVKDRIEKRYRHPVLDRELRKSRSRREKRILEKASKLVRVPKVLHGDDDRVVMEYVEGAAVKDVLDTQVGLAEEIGRLLGVLHTNHIIHGDLTTSNMIYRNNEIVLIDFGLSFTSHKPEDKAVDIHLFKQALESKHHEVYKQAYRRFLKGYREGFDDKEGFEAILNRLRKVEARGRNKAKF